MPRFKSLQTKIFICFISLVLIPLISLGVFSYFIATNFLEEELVQNQAQTIDLIGGNIKSLLDDAKDITSYIANNETIQTLLDQPQTASFTEAQKIMFDYLSNLKLAKTFISFIVIYGDNGFVFRDFNDYYRQVISYEEFQNMPIYITVAAKDEEVHLEYSSSSLFIYDHSFNENLMGRSIKSIYDKEQKLGMLLMGIKRSAMEDMIKNIKIGKSTNIFLFDNNYNIIASKKNETEMETALADDLALRKEILQSKQSSIFQINNKDYYGSASMIEGYRWYAVSLTPLEDIHKRHEIVIRITLTLSISLLLFVGLISMFLSRSITFPVKGLLRSMSNFKRGDFNQKVEVTTKDEIGMLSQKYNEMVMELNELIQKQFISQTHQKIIELKTLQAQIEPHFLYNTLDFIFLNAKINGDNETAEVVHSLSELFRISLSQGKDYYQLEDEFKQIKAYIRIQHARFPNRFCPEFDIDPTIESYYISKLILQPIVENAIIHAFQSTERPGVLKISGKQLDNKLMLTVEDDGCGMSTSQVQALLAPNNQHHNGYGIKNVNERLTMLFGSEYSLQIESQLGQGTKVIIYLPIIESEALWRLLYESHGDR